MNFDARAVERDGLQFDPSDPQALDLLENTSQNAALGPTIHASVNRVPVAVMARQAAPFAAVFRHVEDRVKHLEVGQADISPLFRQTRGNLFVLFGSDLHH